MTPESQRAKKMIDEINSIDVPKIGKLELVKTTVIEDKEFITETFIFKKL